MTTWTNSLITRALILVLLGLAALSGVGFIAVGSYLSISEVLDPWAAGVIVGSGLLVLSLFGGWIALVYLRSTAQTQTPEKQPTEEENQPQTIVDAAAHLGEIVGASFGRSGIRTTDVMIAALVAGTILGASPALRKRLLRRKRYGPPPDSSLD